jgi:hypothetical protein
LFVQRKNERKACPTSEAGRSAGNTNPGLFVRPLHHVLKAPPKSPWFAPFPVLPSHPQKLICYKTILFFKLSGFVILIAVITSKNGINKSTAFRLVENHLSVKESANERCEGKPEKVRTGFVFWSGKWHCAIGEKQTWLFFGFAELAIPQGGLPQFNWRGKRNELKLIKVTL